MNISEHTTNFIQGDKMQNLTFKEWRDVNYYKNCRNKYVENGHKSDSPTEYTNSELMCIYKKQNPYILYVKIQSS